MNVSLPAIMELTEEQISYITNSGQYKISELNSLQSSSALPTMLSEIEGDRFETSRTISVNELSFKAPIMGTKFAEKAKNAIIVKKNSIYAKAALKQNNTETKEIKPQNITKNSNENYISIQENTYQNIENSIDNNSEKKNKKNKKGKGEIKYERKRN